MLFSLPTEKTGLWMTLSIWGCITPCNTLTNLGITQGSYLWTSTPSCLTFSQTMWHSSLCPPPTVSGSSASWQTGSSSWGWANSHPGLSPSALAPLRVALSLHFYSLSTPTTAHLKTSLSSSWSLQMTLQSSASSRMETVVYVVNVVYLTTSPRMQCYVESGSVPVKVVIRKTK